MAKNLLNEGTVRRWGSLANIKPLTESFIDERAEQFTEGEEPLEEETVAEGEETLEEDNYSKDGPGPHREGTGKNNHDGESGVASNQGKEPKDTPDGKLEIPGTGYAGSHENKTKSPEKGSTDGGKQLQGDGKVTEGQLNEMPMPDDEMGDELGGGMPPAPDMGGEMGGDEYGAGGLEGLVQAIAAAISDSTGVQVTVAGHAEPDGDEGLPPVGGEEPPMPAPEVGDELGGEEEEEVVENRFNLSEVDDAAFQQEAYNRGYKRQDEQVTENAEVTEEAAKIAEQEAVVESIARKVAERLTKKNKKAA